MKNESALPLHGGQSVAREAPIPPEVAQRAIEWLLDLQGQDAAAATLEAWQRWRSAHPDHERAWQRIEAVNGRLHPLATPLHAEITKATLVRPGSPRRRQIVAGIAVLLFSGGTVWMARDELRWNTLLADQRTTTGERRHLQLEDGTQIDMNSRSAMAVAFDANERRLRLLEGEILIRTAPDPSGRPFLIETEQGEARALGTRYAVRRQDDLTEVAVFEGAVRIAPRDGTQQGLVLQAGERTRFSRVQAEPAQPVDASRIAWSEGFIVARSMRLSDFLAELGRHSVKPLACDPAVADLRVSGSYPLADIDRILQTLIMTLPVQTVTVTRLWGTQTVRIVAASPAGG